jgi:hypothetical protein
VLSTAPRPTAGTHRCRGGVDKRPPGFFVSRRLVGRARHGSLIMTAVASMRGQPSSSRSNASTRGVRAARSVRLKAELSGTTEARTSDACRLRTAPIAATGFLVERRDSYSNRAS